MSRPPPRPKDLRLDAFERMQRSYDTYRKSPRRRSTAFRALRALVRLCRLHGMTADHAALLAELGKVDEDAEAHWQVKLERRKATRAIREREARQRERDVVSDTFSRQSRRFASVLGRLEQGDTVAEACVAVGGAEEPPVGHEAIAKDYRAVANTYRDAGIFEVPFKTADRMVPLPHPGRRRKKV